MYCSFLAALSYLVYFTRSSLISLLAASLDICGGDDEELPAVVGEWEPSEALRAGPVGDEDLQTIFDGADEWVAPGGAVVLEMAPDQTALIADRFRAAGWQASIHGDLAGRDRAVVARKRG